MTQTLVRLLQIVLFKFFCLEFFMTQHKITSSSYYLSVLYSLKIICTLQPIFVLCLVFILCKKNTPSVFVLREDEEKKILRRLLDGKYVDSVASNQSRVLGSLYRGNFTKTCDNALKIRKKSKKKPLKICKIVQFVQLIKG